VNERDITAEIARQIGWILRGRTNKAAGIGRPSALTRSDSEGIETFSGWFWRASRVFQELLFRDWAQSSSGQG
jgi:hypothetical protein